MSVFLNELKQISRDLDELNISWALIGGLALSLYCEPRSTKDIDIAIAINSDKETEQLASKLLEKGYEEKQLLMHLNPLIRLGFRIMINSNSNKKIPIDFLYRSTGVEELIVNSAVIIEVLPNINLPVAKLAHLLAMKVLSHNDSDRLQDKVDALNLIKISKRQDLEDTKTTLELIVKKGKNRNRDLIFEFENLIKTIVIR